MRLGGGATNRIGLNIKDRGLLRVLGLLTSLSSRGTIPSVIYLGFMREDYIESALAGSTEDGHALSR